MNAEKLKKMAASVRTGGKGSVRRKKVVRRGPATAGAGDQQLNSALKKIAMNQLAADEVKLYKGDKVTVISKAQVSANIQANTVVVRGKATERAISSEDMMDMMDQNSIQKFIEQMRKSGVPAAAAGDDEIPTLEGDFEQAAEVNADAEAAKN